MRGVFLIRDMIFRGELFLNSSRPQKKDQPRKSTALYGKPIAFLYRCPELALAGKSLPATIFSLIFGPNPEARQYTCPHLKSRTLHVSSGCSVILGFVGQLGSRKGHTRGLAEITPISGSAITGQINRTYPHNSFGPFSRPQLYPRLPHPHSLGPHSPCFQ